MTSTDAKPQPAVQDFLVIGGGPAGLTAGLECLAHGKTPLVLEKDGIVGGIARTECFNGFSFDMGGHRFFSKSEWVNALWHDLLGDDFLVRPRMSRIYYRCKFFNYPPRLWNTLSGLGLSESIRVMASYLRWQALPYRRVVSFEQWVTNAFGKRLFEIFFKTYSEKVWGIPCSELRAEWAAQRIKNLSLGVVLRNFVQHTGKRVTSLIERFHYPRRGPGMMWQMAADRIRASGGSVEMDTEVVRLLRSGNQIERVVINHGGEEREVAVQYCISSMPLPELIEKLSPPPPAAVLDAARALRHRAFLTVCLVIDAPDLFPDNWIYIHDPSVRVARIQNYKNWSSDMVADHKQSSLGLEYFCNRGDEFWDRSDEELIALGIREMEAIGLAPAGKVVASRVYRVANAYPVYDSSYAASLETVRDYCDGLENLRTVGRNGLHRYNNMDHSMLTARYAVRMLLLGEQHDLWSINAEQEYHEQIEPSREADSMAPKQ